MERWWRLLHLVTNPPFGVLCATLSYLRELLLLFDIEPAAALRQKLEHELQQFQILSQWRSTTSTALRKQSDDPNKFVRSIAQMSGRQNEYERRTMILRAQIEELSQVIQKRGGWQAAVMLGPNIVNTSVSLAAQACSCPSVHAMRCDALERPVMSSALNTAVPSCECFYSFVGQSTFALFGLFL